MMRTQRFSTRRTFDVSRWLVRGVFVAAVVALPLQLVVREALAEPYPGLYQPSFGGTISSGSTYSSVEPRVTVTEADGALRRVGADALLPHTGVDEGAVFRSAFHEGPRAHDSRTADWLRERLKHLAPESEPRTVTVDWMDVERRVGSQEARLVGLHSRVVMDLEDGS